MPPPGFPPPAPRTPLAEVVGLSAAEAEHIYRKEGFRVRILAPDSIMTLEYMPSRIKLIVADGVVVSAHQG